LKITTSKRSLDIRTLATSRRLWARKDLRVSEACQVLSKNDDHIRAFSLGFFHKLKLIKTPSASFIVASDNDLLLLNG